MVKENHFYNSIAVRFLVMIGSILVIGQLLFALFVIHNNYSQQRIDLQQKAISHAEFLSAVSPDQILANGFYQLETLMRQTASDPDFVYSIILFVDNRPLTNYLDTTNPYVLDAIANTESISILAVTDYLARRSDIIEISQAIVSEGLLVGEVRLGYSTASLQARHLQNIIFTFASSSGLAVILAVLTNIMFNIQIRKPLHDLSVVADQFSQGNFHYRSEITGNDEIGNLQRIFNDMASQIQFNITELDKLSQVASRTTNGVIISDTMGRVEWVNQAFFTITGYTLEEVKGKTPGSVLQGENSSPETIQFIRERVRRGEGFNAEIINYRKSGAEYWVDIEVRPVHDSQGNLKHFIAIETDITERKKSEITLRENLEKARELNELKSRFISMASHEFRTPLTTILSIASFLEVAEGQIPVEKRLARLAKIQTATNEMTALLNDVLLYGKADANRLEFHPTQQDMVLFIREIIEDIRAASNCKRRIDFIHNMLNPCVSFDEKLMRQVVTNLISNAVKYSDPESKVEFEIKSDDTTLTMTICDQGVGIPESDQQHIFEPFHRAKNARDIAGTGLGLAITKKAVEMHSGTISFASKQDEGTCFTITIPLGGKVSDD